MQRSHPLCWAWTDLNGNIGFDVAPLYRSPAKSAEKGIFTVCVMWNVRIYDSDSLKRVR